MLDSDAGSDPFCRLLNGFAVLTKWGLLNLKQEMDATRDNVKTMCHCSRICRDFSSCIMS